MNYIITEVGATFDIEVEHKNSITQKITQIFVNKSSSKLTQDENLSMVR